MVDYRPRGYRREPTGSKVALQEEPGPPCGSRQPEAGSRYPRRTSKRTPRRSLTRLGAEPTAWRARPADPGQRLEQGTGPGPSAGPETDPPGDPRTCLRGEERHKRSEERHTYPGHLRRKRLSAIPGLARFLGHSGKCSVEEGGGCGKLRNFYL